MYGVDFVIIYGFSHFAQFSYSITILLRNEIQIRIGAYNGNVCGDRRYCFGKTTTFFLNIYRFYQLVHQFVGGE